MFPIPATYRHEPDSDPFDVWILAFTADGTRALVVDDAGNLDLVFVGPKLRIDPAWVTEQ